MSSIRLQAACVHESFYEEFLDDGAIRMDAPDPSRTSASAGTAGRASLARNRQKNLVFEEPQVHFAGKDGTANAMPRDAMPDL